MTIIVYRDGVMAADTLVTTHGTRVADTQKVWLEQGWLVGSSGNFCGHVPILNWIRAGADLTSPVDFGKVEDAGAILVSPDQRIFHVDTGCGYVGEEFSSFFAIGSGSDVARGALFHGATSQEAVAAAIALDTSCGGHVFWRDQLGNGPTSVLSLRVS